MRAGRLLDDLPDPLLGQILQAVESPEAGAVGGNLERVEPLAVGVHEEVIAGPDVGLERRQVQAERPDRSVRLSVAVGAADSMAGRVADTGVSWRGLELGLEVQATASSAVHAADTIREGELMQ